MKRPGRILVGLLVVTVLVAGAIFAWANARATARQTQRYEVHAYDLPIPRPLSAAELDELRATALAARASDGQAPVSDEGVPDEGVPDEDLLAGLDLDGLARERAIARGEHLVNSRFSCAECHGADLSGGTMVDDPAIGTLLGPNITPGGVVAGWTATDWERKIRHGVSPSGHGGFMPTDDFANMSDEELGDIVTYLGTFAASDHVVPAVSLGPVGTILTALGQLAIPAAVYAERTEHEARPPAAEVTTAFGAHVAQVCTGCHRSGLEGGPIRGGAPDWLPAANLTSGEGGVLEQYDLASFSMVMREGTKPSGLAVGMPMALMPKYNRNMTDTELGALFLYLQSLPPRQTGR